MARNISVLTLVGGRRNLINTYDFILNMAFRMAFYIENENEILDPTGGGE